MKLYQVTWLAESVTGAGPLVYRMAIRSTSRAAAEQAAQDLLGRPRPLLIVRTRRLWPWSRR